jgi:S1-C subfamily serine protease
MATSVVKLAVSKKKPDFKQPWVLKKQTESSSSACVILFQGKPRLLTNAHAVRFAVLIEACPAGRTKKSVCKVVAYNDRLDLALLVVAKEEVAFFEGLAPLELCAQLPANGSELFLWGFPGSRKANEVCVTKGVVSRVQTRTHSQLVEPCAVVQIDASMNPGNSGGAALSEGKLIGVARSHEGQNRYKKSKNQNHQKHSFTL